MKRFFLALILLCSLLQSSPGSASGSSNVYISRYDFSVSLTPIFELENKKLYDLFESNKQSNAYVVNVNPYLYQQIHFYNCWGIDAVVHFEDYGIVTFAYYPQYKATLGYNENSELVVLQPRVVPGQKPETLCGAEESCDDELSGTWAPPR